jgi:hypothetical protein
MNTELRDNIGKLLLDTGRAHHKAIEVADGADPEWPIWYAEYTKDAFAEQFGMNLSKSQLIYCLMNAHFEHEARALDSEERWMPESRDIVSYLQETYPH